jgi:hypothetical protein
MCRAKLNERDSGSCSERAVASSNRQQKTGPFNTTADITIKFVLDGCE